MNEITVLGSPFEISLRILLMLDEISNAELDEQQICSIDFISVYAADFDLLDENLHGNGTYRFSEFSARKALVSDALKTLVLNGNIIFTSSKRGFTYKISSFGREISQALISTYAGEYRLAVRTVYQHFNGHEEDMLKDINQRIVRSIQEDTDE